MCSIQKGRVWVKNYMSTCTSVAKIYALVNAAYSAKLSCRQHTMFPLTAAVLEYIP